MPASPNTTTVDVAIVGAGIAGLTAARALQDASRSVVVVDKGRSVGGRLATRRIGGGRFDHGAQFFTVRGDAFREVVTTAVEEGIVHVWNHGFSDPGDGYPRFVGSAGMNSMAKWLARDLPILADTRLSSIGITDEGWELCAEEVTIHAESIIVTPPVPQSLDLLDAGNVELNEADNDVLRAVRYHRVMALLATLSGPPQVHTSGGLQLAEGPFSFIGDNHNKTISSIPAVTFHANHQWSLEHWDDDQSAAHERLIELAQPWLGSATIVTSELKRWLYAGPVEIVPHAAFMITSKGRRCVFAGDAFAGPKVEGAFNSGLAAAAIV